MSWSLALRNGDLTLDGARLGQVNNAQKLVQDLRCAILEPRGHDSMHPSYGSLLDGGIDEFGRRVETIIGESNWERAELQIRVELQRIIIDHQKRQVSRANRDRQRFGSSTINPEELLLSIGDISMAQAQDKLLVTITLINGRGADFNINIPIQDTTVN